MCAFLMYAMWWHKPLAPKEPSVIGDAWLKPLLAYMYICGGISGEIKEDDLQSQTIVKTLFASMHLYSKKPEIDYLCFRRVLDPDETPPGGSHSISRFSSEIAQPPHATEVSFGTAEHIIAGPLSAQCHNQIQAKGLEKSAESAFFERRPRVKGRTFTASGTSSASLTRWALAAQAVEQYHAIRQHCLNFSHGDCNCMHFKGEEYLVDHVPNWPWDDLLRDVGGLIVGMILWLACFVYGGIHLAA